MPDFQLHQLTHKSCPSEALTHTESNLKPLILYPDQDWQATSESHFPCQSETGRQQSPSLCWHFIRGLFPVAHHSWAPLSTKPCTAPLSHLMKTNGLQHFNLEEPAPLSDYLNLIQLGGSSLANLWHLRTESRPVTLTHKQVEVLHGCTQLCLLYLSVSFSSPLLP